MNKPVTEEDVEEFLKKMKAQDYSVIDQLRKMPAQISLLSLLIHSKEHRQVLTRIVNPISLMGNQDTFGLGFNPSRFDRK